DGGGRDREVGEHVAPLEAFDREHRVDVDRGADGGDERELEAAHDAGEHDRRDRLRDRLAPRPRGEAGALPPVGGPPGPRRWRAGGPPPPRRRRRSVHCRPEPQGSRAGSSLTKHALPAATTAWAGSALDERITGNSSRKSKFMVNDAAGVIASEAKQFPPRS